MPMESTVDRALHARAVADVVFESRRQSTITTQRHIAKTRRHLQTTKEAIRNLKFRMREHAMPLG
jgi:predicted translin family RNA/ssDNA-binding protein